MRVNANRNSSRSTSQKHFLEFFAGIGLLHEGLRRSGWRCAYANDIDDKKRQMYEGHFGKSPYYHVGDVWQTASVLERLPPSPAFLATASFPCIDLSLAGHWKGFKGEHSSTYFGFLEVLRQLGGSAPKLVMLENVNGFLTSHNGEDFSRAVSELADLGYWIDAITLDARWFVPQSRPRVFVFGFHETLASDHIVRRNVNGFAMDEWRQAVDATGAVRPDVLFEMFDRIKLSTGWATTRFKPPEQRAYSLKDVLDNDAKQDWWTAEETLKHYVMMEAPSRSRVDQLIRSKATAVGTAFRRTRRGSTRTEVRFDIAGCLRTPKGGSAKQIVVALVKGKLRMRWMSPVEYARLQGASDFNITVPDTQALYGFGDAVCVPAIQWICDSILDPVFDSVSRRRQFALARNSA